MAAHDSDSRGTRKLPRWSLASLSLVHAFVLGWAAVVLPWRSWTVLSLLSAVLATTFVGTAVLAALAHRRLALAWRITSVLALVFLIYVGWSLLGSAVYIGSVYRGLGEGVAAALVAVFGLVVLCTVPIAAWGIAATGGIRPSKKLGGATVTAIALVGIRLWFLVGDAHGTELVDTVGVEAVRARLSTVNAATLAKTTGPRTSLMIEDSVSCAQPVGAAIATIVATHLRMDNDAPRAVSHCFQADDVAGAADALVDHLTANASRGPVKIDLVTAWYPVKADRALAESLAFRPGLDGVCASNGRCLMPWQLVALDAFVSHAPIAAVPDARFGVSVDALAARLDAPVDELVRIDTQGWLVAPGKELVALSRVPAPNIEASADTIRAASLAASRYVYTAQNREGLFNYIVMPFTGRVETGNFSIARQAGTTLAACELTADTRIATRLAQRSLGLLAKHEQVFSIGDQEAGVLRWNPNGTEERIGPTALALAAFITCRALVGDAYDPLIGRLSRTLLAVQRANGSFHHFIDTTNGTPPIKKGSIFVDGQVILSLSLMETLAVDGAGVFPPRQVLVDAAERAMTFFGEQYWDIPLEPFLYIEENWHCIAAARSLDHHRNAAYERFCLDYVAMKARIVHGPASAVHPDFKGGYGFGNLVPPHNTATAGYGEALASAIRIKQANGSNVSEEVERLKWVLGFLLKNQWTTEACWACSPKVRITGAFSEHMASPSVRIDYVQHVWSAIGHGAVALGWAEERVL